MAHNSNEANERYKRRREKEDAHRKMLPGEDDMPLPPPVETIHGDAKPQRNDPCPCGSGKKYKKCCGKE